MRRMSMQQQSQSEVYEDSNANSYEGQGPPSGGGNSRHHLYASGPAIAAGGLAGGRIGLAGGLGLKGH